MSFKLGSTAINTLKLGSTAISKAYLGSTLVFGSTGPHFQVDTDGTLMDGLVGYWKMEDATDVFGAYNGTATNITFGTAKVNKGAISSGSGSIRIGESADLSLLGDYSYGCWAKISGTGFERIINKDQALDQRGGYSMVSINRQIYIAHQSGGSGTGGATGYFPTANVPVFYIVSYNGSTVKLFANNTEIYSFNWTTDLARDPSAYLFTGTYGASSAQGQYMTGYVDELGLWSKALSTQERTDLYNSGNGQTIIS